MSTGKLHKSSQTMEECIAFIRFRCNSNSSACICMSPRTHTHICTFVCCSYFAIDFATLWCVACDEWETTTTSRSRRHMVVRLAKGANKEACQHTYLHFSISYETDSAQLVQPPPLVLASQHIATGSATQTAAQHTQKAANFFVVAATQNRKAFHLPVTKKIQPPVLHFFCCTLSSTTAATVAIGVRPTGTLTVFAFGNHIFFCLESFTLYETPYRARGVECAAQLKK